MTKSSVPQSKIQEMVSQRWGSASRLSQLAEGLDSQAFGFRQGDIDYVIRINRAASGFEKDRFTYRRFASLGLPIPEVLEIGPLDGHFFCISRRAPGARLQDVDASDLPHLVGPLVRVLETIAGSDVRGTTGFGNFNAGGAAPYASWQAFLTGIADANRFDWKRASHHVEMKLVARLFQMVEALAEHCPEERSLIHGDFGSYNVLSDGRAITAVIDWDRALFGDPLYDIGNLFFWREERLRHLIDYYERGSSSIPQWHERVLCYQIRIGLQEVYESAVGAGPINLEWLTKRCMDIIEHA